MKALLKKWWLLNSLLLFLLLGNLKAQTFQNIVPNGSFETYTQCPFNSSQIYFAAPWTGPSANSSDYFNSCSNDLNVPKYGGVNNPYYYCSAIDGQAYAGIYVYQPQDYREYLQVKLNDSLQSETCYYVEWYAANGQYVPFSVNNLATHFSSTLFSSTLTPANSLINVAPHVTNYNNPILEDTVKWAKISGIYEAQGHERYLTLGNFKSNAATDTMRLYPIGTGPVLSVPMAYILVDAVSMYSISPYGALPWSYRDTTINEDDSVFIGNHMGGLNFHPKWYKSDGTFITTNAGITVKPEITSEYVVQFTLCGVPHSDTVKVTVNPKNGVGITKFKKWSTTLKMYPQPAGEVLNFENEMITEGEVVSVTIENSFAQTLRKEDACFRNRKAKIKIDELPNGVYFVTLKTQNNESITKKMVVAK